MLFDNAELILNADESDSSEVKKILSSVGFEDDAKAHQRFLGLCGDEESRQSLREFLPMLLAALTEAASSDASLINFERYVQSVPNRAELLTYLSQNPRAIEILIKLFVNSQFLTEILLKNPDYLAKLTNHKRLAEFKTRDQFYDEAIAAAMQHKLLADRFNAIRHFQQWELLRIGACDNFGLLDLKTVTVQLSLLADSIVQSCLFLLSEELSISTEGFAVLAFGKLGGEELNYSSDIDLVFLSDGDATRYWPLGQRLIKALHEATSEGFLYRVDMRLRPWGRSGALVNTVDAHVSYLTQHGKEWEMQALIKARVIAGNQELGNEFLRRVEPLIYGAPLETIRQNVREMKSKIEEGLAKKGRKWGEVKSGQGSIRDIEFVTQGLQLAYGKKYPDIRSFNTLDALVRLADFGLIHADEYRQLRTGYMFLRTIEHALQLTHHKQTHSLPTHKQELSYLARRLDFPNAEYFIAHYEKHSQAIRKIYDRHIGGEEGADGPRTLAESEKLKNQFSPVQTTYGEIFSEEEQNHHRKLIEELSESRLIRVEAKPADGETWSVTIVGYDHPGDLSRICGLLFVYGFHIVSGHVFTSEQMAANSISEGKNRTYLNSSKRQFVNVFLVRSALKMVLPEVWNRYQADLEELMQLAKAGKQREAQGNLAKRVAGALRENTEIETTLLPVSIKVDNESSPDSTMLHIEADDTTGFLYELTNGLALFGIDARYVVVLSEGNRIRDTLYVTDEMGEKITQDNKLRELRAAIVLIKHFTHLLPRSPNPEQALLQFRDFLEKLFQQPDWMEEFSSLESSDVLNTLAQLLGVSSFLWEDFLRLQYANLFPVVTDVAGLSAHVTKADLQLELDAELTVTEDITKQTDILNQFKDREMFRVDIRHIIHETNEFGQFSAELTDVAEVIVDAAYRLCSNALQKRYGIPELEDEISDGEFRPCPMAVLALGKCGGRELGFASDIELMFVYQAAGKTTGPEVITNNEYFLKLVEMFTHTIESRQEGIFQLDLRLRPYGNAGSLAVSLEAFQTYFDAEGAAWPYERQALVKLRAIAGDEEFGQQVRELRNQLIYDKQLFDCTAMRAMREKQVRQLVRAGTFNAKLSPGGLVDVEYLVQGLQMLHGGRLPGLRNTNTSAAMKALQDEGILSSEDYQKLSDGYVFLRRLIDALRMVRGHAKDLTVPKRDSEEYVFLARRLGYKGRSNRLATEIETCTQHVLEVSQLLDDGESSATKSQK